MPDDRAEILEFLERIFGDERRDWLSIQFSDNRDQEELPPDASGFPRHKVGDEGTIMIAARYVLHD